MRGGESGREMGEGGLEGSEDIVGHKRCGRRMRKGKKEKRQANVAGENVKVTWNASEAPMIGYRLVTIISVFTSVPKLLYTTLVPTLARSKSKIKHKPVIS